MNGYILDTDTWIEFFHHRGGVADQSQQTKSLLQKFRLQN